MTKEEAEALVHGIGTDDDIYDCVTFCGLKFEDAGGKQSIARRETEITCSYCKAKQPMPIDVQTEIEAALAQNESDSR